MTDRGLVSSTGAVGGPGIAEAPHHDRRHGTRPLPSRPPVVRRPTVLSSEWHGGERVSRVLRADGSVFTVTVPALGVYDHTDHLAPQHAWISEDSGRPELSTVGALRLVAALSGPPRAGSRPAH